MIYNSIAPSQFCLFSSKLWEKKSIKDYDYFNKHNILTPSQYGFRKDSTICLAILDLIEKINDAINKGE